MASTPGAGLPVSRLPRQRLDFEAARAAPLPRGRARDEHEVADDEVGRDEGEARPAEDLRPGRGDGVEARLFHRRRDIGRVRAVVRSRGQRDRPRVGRRALARQLLCFGGAREDRVHVARGPHALGEIEMVRAKLQAADVLVQDQERALAGAVGLHDPDLVVRRLDALDDREAAPAPDGCGENARAFLRDRARARQVAGEVRPLDELGELRLAHREPRDRGESRQALFEVLLDARPVLLLRESREEPSEPLQARLERRLAVAAARVPRFEIVERGHETDERMPGVVIEPQVPRRPSRGEQSREVEPEDFIGLRRRPSRGIRQERNEEIGHGVPERPANGARVVVGFQELGERLDVLAPERLPILPDPGVGLHGFAIHLGPRPGLQVDGAARLDALPLLDLPGIGVEVGDERLRAEKLQGRAGQEPLRPRLVLEESHGRLVAVKSHAELRFPDERAGPLRFVSARARSLAPARDRRRGFLEFLLRDEPVDLLPVRRGCRRTRRDRRLRRRGPAGRLAVRHDGRGEGQEKDGEPQPASLERLRHVAHSASIRTRSIPEVPPGRLPPTPAW